MWNKVFEADRLLKLRKAALIAMNGQTPLKKDIKLSVTICAGTKNDHSIGDLDTFITGICDGLMKRAAGSNLCGLWEAPENSNVHPDRSIAIDDDSQVVRIKAAKVKGKDGEQYYDVTLEGI